MNKNYFTSFTSLFKCLRDEVIVFFLLLGAFIKFSLKKIFSFEKEKKSVCFIGNDYNKFFTMAEELKKNGWRAISVSLDNSSFTTLYHKKIDVTKKKDSVNLFCDIILNYKVVHVYNQTDPFYLGRSIFFKKCISLPMLKKIGIIIFFSPSGCLDGSTSAEINLLHQGLCEKCIWQHNFCNESKNLRKKDFIKRYSDVFFNEIDLLKSITTETPSVNFPVLPLDSTHYNPNIEIPDKFKICKDDEAMMIVLTAYGNEKIRVNSTRDIKGKKHMLFAINKLIDEGINIKHVHITGIHSKFMRYYIAQADIILDQLNYGTIGNFAREGMMSSKIVITNISNLTRKSNVAMFDCPAIHADEKSVYKVLKNTILLSPDEKNKIALQSRYWMEKWYSPKNCYKRYNLIVEKVINGLPLGEESEYVF